MNCILVLSEVLADEGGMGVNQALALHVLSKATDFNEWGLVQVRRHTLMLMGIVPTPDASLPHMIRA